MFKKKATKSEIRNQLQAEVSMFLQNGGSIQQVEMGASGLVDGKYSSLKSSFEKTAPQSRTPVHGLLATIDNRKKRNQPTSAAKSKKRPTQKVIYDDFGEPVRTVWVEE
ncbi:MAG: hypothetical protein ACRBB4_14510 [Neptuniibacter sp.]|jgi:hypothetical protein|uniref:hypothetical protein n=1 Tax=Neptuniibacter sp. TaxID=1962643 RepID=UPI003B5C7033